jgi:hypothetical protein
MKGKNTQLLNILCYPLLTDVSKHTTLQNAHVLFVVIDGIQFRVFCGENSSYLLIGDIPTHFTMDVLSVVKLTTFQGDKKICLIRFHNIPQILPSNESCPSCFPPMTFSVCQFKKEQLIDVRFAIKSNKCSPNFGVGCFDMRLFFEKFRRNNLLVYCIPVLWKNLIKALCDIEYFKIYNYHDFQTSVLVCFQRMFIFPQHENTIREQFYSFVWKLLKMNSWFLIVEQSIQHFRRIPDKLIGLFLDLENPPTVNFIDHKLGVVGLTKQEGDVFYIRSIFALVFFQSTDVCVVCSNEPEGFFNNSQESDDILSMLFPSYDDCPILRPRLARVDTSAISEGFLRFGPLWLIVFKTGKSIDVFSQREDNTIIKRFNIYLFILSKIFAVGDELNQLTEHFTHLSCISVEDLVEGFVKDRFLPIFDGTATIEQICAVLYKSDFDCVLQGLCQEFEEFPEQLRKECLMKYKEEVEKGKVENPTPVEDLFKAHLDSIRKNDFIGDFKRIFEFLLEKLGNRDDLTPEIREILHFLGQLVEFLNPV